MIVVLNIHNNHSFAIIIHSSRDTSINETDECPEYLYLSSLSLWITEPAECTVLDTLCRVCRKHYR